jgi:hypothetical protein
MALVLDERMHIAGHWTFLKAVRLYFVSDSLTLKVMRDAFAMRG